MTVFACFAYVLTCLVESLRNKAAAFTKIWGIVASTHAAGHMHLGSLRVPANLGSCARCAASI